MEILTVEIIDELYGWGYTFRGLVNQTRKFEGDQIVVPINSYGGDVFEGLSIYNYLKGHGAKIETRIVAYAMSMGTIIACAGDHVKMPANGWYMVHNPYVWASGDHKDLKKTSDMLVKMTNDLANIYQKKTGLPIEEILAMMEEETWLTAEEAKAKGFVDELTEGMALAAYLDTEVLNKLSNIPEPVMKAHGIHKPENSQPMKDLFKMLSTFFGKTVDENMKPEELQALIDAKAKADSERDTQIETLGKDFKALKDGLGDAISKAVSASLDAALKTNTETLQTTLQEAQVKAIDDLKTDIEGQIKNVAGEVNKIKGASEGDRKKPENAVEGLGVEFQPEGVEVFETDAFDSIMQ